MRSLVSETDKNKKKTYDEFTIHAHEINHSMNLPYLLSPTNRTLFTLNTYLNKTKINKNLTLNVMFKKKNQWKPSEKK